MKRMHKLKVLKEASKGFDVVGLDDLIVSEFLNQDNFLAECVDDAYEQFQYIKAKFPEFEHLKEKEKIEKLQKYFINFYSKETLNPYIPLAAKGPWIVTTEGAVLHDSGGYGMLGFGHQPSSILPTLRETHHVMANIMTSNFAQYDLSCLLLKEIGHTRHSEYLNPLEQFVCLNSGSEGTGFALRVSDAKALSVFEKNPKRERKFLTLKQSFHGRTDSAARVSSSSLPGYQKYLASFKNRDELFTVEINNLVALSKIFEEAEEKNIFIQAVILEPVMGEGNPGVGLTPAFYRLARKLAREHGSSFIIDSIQAGIRAHGCLSILDYPGFEQEETPDCEVYSKALNAGQYPLSVVAMTADYASYYKVGLYGNTMTSNPKALSIACSVLEALTPSIRENIRARGQEFVEEGLKLKADFEWLVEGVHGTGLLFCLEINKKVIDVVGFDGLETKARKAGIGVIHGGHNALRFTPWFGISSLEIKLIFNKLRDVFKTLKKHSP